MTIGIPGSVPLGYVQQAVSTAAGLSTIPASATYAVIVPESQAIRYRDDGTNPTATVGVPVVVNQAITYDGPLDKIKLVAQTGTASVSIAYYSGRR